MRNSMIALLWWGVGFGVSRCVTEHQRFTGFLHDYSILKPHPSIPGGLVYWNPKIDPRRYKSVIVEPVDIDFKNRNGGSPSRSNEVTALRRFVTDELTKAVSKHAGIVADPGEHVLRLRLQVANLQYSRPIGEPAYGWLPRDYVLGSANIETAAYDSTSNELVVAYVSPRDSVQICTPSLLEGAPNRWATARNIIRSRIVVWTDNAARAFKAEPGGKLAVARLQVRSFP